MKIMFHMMNGMRMEIGLCGMPLDLSQTHRGVNMGPSALRYADLADRFRQIGYQVKDMGNVDIPVRETLIETGRSRYNRRQGA